MNAQITQTYDEMAYNKRVCGSLPAIPRPNGLVNPTGGNAYMHQKDYIRSMTLQRFTDGTSHTRQPLSDIFKSRIYGIKGWIFLYAKRLAAIFKKEGQDVR